MSRALRSIPAGGRTASSRPLRLAVVVLLAGAVPALAQRLPGGVTPLHYDITVAPDLQAATFAGEETIRVTLERPSRSITLNAAQITFGEVTIAAAGRSSTAQVTLDAKQEQATLTTAAPIPAGEAAIHIRYTGILNDDLRGLYLSRTDRRRYAVTQMEATDARRMFPSFDEPAYKATFTLTAIVDEGDSAISNGPVVSDTPGPSPGKHTIAFAPSPKMSSYLVALAVGDFVCNEGRSGEIPIRVCSTPDKKALTGFALEATEQIVRFYNQWYTIPYPFQKLDIVAVPDFSAGAMENVAAIFYRESFLLAEADAPVATRRTIAEVLAHEIAHQWFGDLVTMQWWDDIWLNEGFATWMQTKPVAAWKPEWNEAMTEASDNQRAMTIDELRTTRPVRARATTPAEINELFDPIAYEKGAAVLRMIEGWVGEQPFRQAVNAYIERFKYGNATAEDFWTTVAGSTKQPVDRVMKTFVDQPGVPVVRLSTECAGGTGRAALAQDRFVIDPGGAAAPASSPASPVWQIPVCVRTSAGGTSCTLLTTTSGALTLPACPAWTMGNANGRGYYRTELDEPALTALKPDISRLTAPERLTLLSDEWAMVRAGRHDVSTFLDLAEGFRQERTPQVLATLAGDLRAIADEFTTPATRPAFQAKVAELLGPALAEIGTESSRTAAASAGPDVPALRATLLAALGSIAGTPDAIDAARRIVKTELADPGSTDPALLDVAITVAAEHGDAALYDAFLERFTAAVDPQERRRYFNGLASFTDPALVRRTLDLILGPQVRAQDVMLYVAAMLGNPTSRDLAWRLVRERWDELQKKTGEAIGTYVVVAALAQFCGTDEADSIQSFFEAHPVPDAARTLSQTVERVRACGAQAAKQRPALARWLR
jgi:aminopeptidase N